MYEDEHERRYKEAILGLFNAQEVEPGIVIHSGKDSPSFIAAIVSRVREVFSSEPKIAKPEKETLATARARKENRDRAIKETNERVEARYIRRKMKNPDKDISRFISTSDMDMNAFLAEPSRVGKRFSFIHTDQLDADRKLIKKEVKKKIKQKKQTLKVAKKDDRMIEIEKIEADILALKARIKEK